MPIFYDMIWASIKYWTERNYIRPGRTIPKLIVGDADGILAGMFKKTFQETLPIPVHAVVRGNHKAIRNDGFHRYLNKVQKIKSADKGNLHQWL